MNLVPCGAAGADRRDLVVEGLRGVEFVRQQV